MVKKKLIVSVSGGETSMYMAWWLFTHCQHLYHMVFVFANTGEETEETLLFVKRFSEHYKIPIVWVEAVPRVKLLGKIVEIGDEVFGLNWIGGNIGTTYRKVTYETASRNGEPFEKVVQKFGIPNLTTPHCTRELKERPIKAYARAIGWKDYYTAIGIREDEMDRVNEKWRELKLIYPLIKGNMRPMTKPKINFWWSQQPFRLNLKGYQGNCRVCWKKSKHKLYQLAIETPSNFDFVIKMQMRYGNYIPKSRLLLQEKDGKEIKLPVRFYRENKSAEEIIKEAQNWDGVVTDDMQEFESCEVFAECQ